MANQFLIDAQQKYSQQGLFLYINGQYTPVADLEDEWKFLIRDSRTDNTGMTIADDFTGWIYRKGDTNPFQPLRPMDIYKHGAKE